MYIWSSRCPFFLVAQKQMYGGHWICLESQSPMMKNSLEARGQIPSASVVFRASPTDCLFAVQMVALLWLKVWRALELMCSVDCSSSIGWRELENISIQYWVLV